MCHFHWKTSTTKDTTGNWVAQEPVSLSYDITTSALVESGETITSSVDGQGLAELENIKEAGTPVKWQIANVSGANNRTKGSVIASGSAQLTQLEIQGTEQNCRSVQCNLTRLRRLYRWCIILNHVSVRLFGYRRAFLFTLKKTTHEDKRDKNCRQGCNPCLLFRFEVSYKLLTDEEIHPFITEAIVALNDKPASHARLAQNNLPDHSMRNGIL